MSPVLAALEPTPIPANDVAPVRGRGILRFLTCGSVDDGKSTLIGRILHEAQVVLDDQVEALRHDSRRWGTTEEEIDFALLLDGLEAEREQGITIDVAYRFFATKKRAFIVADTPGHAQYTRNMATGASTADVAILLVDARKGLLEQTKRHATIASLLGIAHVVLAINKIDLVSFSQMVFDDIVRAFESFSGELGFRSIVPIPISARFGDNVAAPSPRTPWYLGPALLGHLEGIELAQDEPLRPFRFWVQWVNRPNLDFRGVAGTISSGRLSVGDPVLVASTGRIARVQQIVTMAGERPEAVAGDAVTLTFTEGIDVGRGELLAAPRHRPVVSKRFAANLVWFADEAAEPGRRYLLKIGTRSVSAVLTTLEHRLDVATLAREPAEALGLNEIGRALVECRVPIAFDRYVDSKDTGAFILIDTATNATVAAGMIADSDERAREVHRHPTALDGSIRAMSKRQLPLAVWLTGLPGSGKSTIANLVERRLHALGHHTMLLDGDNLRQGLNHDLGFDPASRVENVRRVGEVAKLMTEAGLIVIVALVSPFKADRAKVAALFPQGRFLEVFVDAPIETCRARDPKGLYAKADTGRLAQFTGVGQGYEMPEAPDLVLATAEDSAEAAAERVVELVLDRSREPAPTALDAAQL